MVLDALHVLRLTKSARGFPNQKLEYDPKQTLLRNDIKLKKVYVNGTPVEVLILNIKCPKEANGSSVKVELFANGTKSD